MAERWEEIHDAILATWLDRGGAEQQTWAKCFENACKRIAELERERDLLLIVVRHAEALIDNQANITTQAYAVCNSLMSAMADWRRLAAAREVSRG